MKPTREKIKKAFKETIERWEKIVKDPTYHGRSECPLCCVDDGIKYGNHAICTNTPYHNFAANPTSENALAELNFLRKVYIWYIDNGKDVEVKPKEGWEDITEEITITLSNGSIGVNHKNKLIAFDGNVTQMYPEAGVVRFVLCQKEMGRYKLNCTPHVFQVLKKR